jgi:uncharacterized protein YjbJ (UPF0337 family)
MEVQYEAVSLDFAGITVGAAITLLYLDQPSLQHETGLDGFEDAANRVWKWGSQARVAGGGDSIVGRVKEEIGRVTGNDDLASEGVLDQAAGAVKDAAGQLGHAAGQTIHDLNR